MGPLEGLSVWYTVCTSLSKQHGTLEPIYRTLTEIISFSIKITSEITGKKLEIDKTSFAITRSLKSYIIGKNFKMIVCTSTNLTEIKNPFKKQTTSIQCFLNIKTVIPSNQEEIAAMQDEINELTEENEDLLLQLENNSTPQVTK